jgi:excisionase family DNA binding protein
MPKVNLTPQNMSAVIEQLMKDIDETQAKFNRVLLQQAEREAHLLQQLGAANEKLNDALARIKELENKMDGRTTAKNVMNAQEAAAYIRLKSVNSIYAKVAAGQLRATKSRGNRYYFQLSDLNAYLAGKFFGK